MVTFSGFAELNKLREADVLYNRVIKLSEYFFKDEVLGDTSGFIQQAERLIEGSRSTDTLIGIFNHRTWTPLIEVGADEFWGPIPGSKEDRIKTILGYLEPDYHNFPNDSVRWQINTLKEIPFSERINFRFYHCGIRYYLPNDKHICLFSKGVPFQYDVNREFNFTFNYVQNIFHLIKKNVSSYWIRMTYGQNHEFVRTFHSVTGYSKRDLLSQQEKKILSLIAEDVSTKEISDQLSISPNTVSNHRSNMIDRLGARDATALVQLAKMAAIL
jgi:DNA-binding CsgD family transcriptional regulator